MKTESIQNKWNVYRGIAVTAIEEKDQRELQVFCPELLPCKNGSVNEQPEIMDVVLNNTGDSQEVIKVNTSDTILATYFGRSMTNRSIPTIHIGEQLEIYNYAGSDTFYWAPIGRDDNIRKREHLRFHIADKPKTLDELTDDNTYYMEFDTKYDKYIIITTAKSDEEPFKYTFKFDAKNGNIILQDDDGNSLTLNSSAKIWLLKNKDNSKVELNGPNVFVGNASGSLITLIGSSTTINNNGGSNVVLDKEHVIIETNSNISIGCGSSSINMTKNSISIVSPNTTVV